MKHGHSANGRTSPTYNSWFGMFQRCENKNNAAYHRYGARGIEVCARWHGDDGFSNFLSDMGERPAGMTLDRKDTDGSYEPSNCRWASPKTQAANKTNNIHVTIDGETLILSEWCERLGLNYKSVHTRISAGWDVADALLSPPVFNPRVFLEISVEHGGKSMTVGEWIAANGIKRSTAYTRINSLGWTIERAVTTPVGHNGSSVPKNTKRSARHGIVIREVLMKD